MTGFCIKSNTGQKGVEMISENNNKVKHVRKTLRRNTATLNGEER